MEHCPICKMPAELPARSETLFDFECFRCGTFQISAIADAILRNNPIPDAAVPVVSGYIHQNQGIRIDQRELQGLLRLTPPSVVEKALRLLQSLAEEHPVPGESIKDPAPAISYIEQLLRQSDSKSPFPAELENRELVRNLRWLAVGSVATSRELGWILQHALLGRDLIGKGRQFIFAERGYDSIIITPSGWDAIERARQSSARTKIGFVAMAFRPELTELFEQGLAKGIEMAGYEALRIDRTEHNNRIDDEIVATIKRSRFVVADFTIGRGGIYFEAGFALGLNLPVIWTVRADELENVHFDTRQYNFILWQDGNWVDLQKALRNRIEATIGKGPLSQITVSGIPASEINSE